VACIGFSSFTPGAYDIFAQVRNPASESSAQTGRISVDIADQDVDAGVLAVRPNGSLAGQLIVSESLFGHAEPIAY